ncbi:PAS domain-containing protein [Spirosoma sp. HMF3257]|uniref:histidine kinase n=1 Tax=Spirosoma telluris TaxID=2183553 RepID=A0A327NFJ8_9BACT|nr:PAS domain-containing protein [Spirosoma telluris]RAI74110.1 histidine kinase [Spirosoma telluris]
MDQANSSSYLNTERLQSPEAIRLALAAYDASLNSIISMVAIRDNNGKVIDFLMQTANQAVEQSLSISPDQLIGQRMVDLFPGNIESGLFALYERVVETGQAERTTLHYSDANVPDAWFDVSAVRSEPDHLVVTFMNITASKQAELEVKRQADLLQTVLDHTQTAISQHEAIRDRAGKIIDFRTLLANRQAIRMWGELAEPILTKTFFDIATPDQQLNDFPKYVRVVETGEPDLSEFNIGDQWWLRLTAKSGDGVVISNIDISENRRYRQQIEATNVELKRSNENLQSFAYIASHDLQEPLRKIMAFGDMLNERFAPVLGTEGLEMLARMQSAAERMSVLIRDLLDYSKIWSQRDMFRSFSLTKLIEDISEDLWHPIQQTNARIEIGVGTPLPDLIGDRAQLRQLFQNLLSNALKFHQTDSAGNPLPPLIQVAAAQVSDLHLPDTIRQDLRTNQTYWAISISDNGIGFEQKYADQIFQVFQRLHSRKKFGGTGIGLAVVKKVIEQHDGAIQVDSEVNKGTTFTVYLPA